MIIEQSLKRLEDAKWFSGKNMIQGKHVGKANWELLPGHARQIEQDLEVQTKLELEALNLEAAQESLERFLGLMEQEAGKEVAISIDRYLSRMDLAAGRAKTREREDLPPMVTPTAGRRTVMPKLAGDQRRRTFDEVHVGYNEEQAVKEAQCCLHCGVSRHDGGRMPVSEYLAAQRRFRHLTEVEIAKIQDRVDADYEALLKRCGLR